MRIISGTYRGRQIRPPRGFKARPTTDFAKEGLFNILVNHFDLAGLEVLDLFSGTGSIAYEFASRGAGSVVAVESEELHSRFIRSVCNDLEMDQVTVIRGDAFRYLRKPVQSFDLVFADPPYGHPQLEELPGLVFAGQILSEGGIFILEHSGKHQFSGHPQFLKQRNYGSVHFSFFIRS